MICETGIQTPRHTEELLIECVRGLWGSVVQNCLSWDDIWHSLNYWHQLLIFSVWLIMLEKGTFTLTTLRKLSTWKLTFFFYFRFFYWFIFKWFICNYFTNGEINLIAVYLMVCISASIPIFLHCFLEFSLSASTIKDFCLSDNGW